MKEFSAGNTEAHKHFFETARTAISNFTDAAGDFAASNNKIRQEFRKTVKEISEKNTAELFSASRHFIKSFSDLPGFSAVTDVFLKQNQLAEDLLEFYTEAASRQISFANLVFNPFSALYAEWFSTSKKVMLDLNQRTEALAQSNLKTWNEAVKTASGQAPKEMHENSPEKKTVREGEKRVKESVL